MNQRPRASGVTLLELLIAVAIIGILAFVAVPSYIGYAIRANRADAQQTLLRAAQGFERYAVTNGSKGYLGATLAKLVVATPVLQSPATGTPIYTLSSTATETSFTIIATPSPGGPNRSDGNLAINQNGVKSGKWSR